eukprot:454334-Pyramimonas_sp.AAC.1
MDEYWNTVGVDVGHLTSLGFVELTIDGGMYSRLTARQPGDKRVLGGRNKIYHLHASTKARGKPAPRASMKDDAKQ